MHAHAYTNNACKNNAYRWSCDLRMHLGQMLVAAAWSGTYAGMHLRMSFCIALDEEAHAPTLTSTCTYVYIFTYICTPTYRRRRSMYMQPVRPGRMSPTPGNWRPLAGGPQGHQKRGSATPYGPIVKGFMIHIPYWEYNGKGYMAPILWFMGSSYGWGLVSVGGRININIGVPCSQNSHSNIISSIRQNGNGSSKLLE